MVSTGRYMRSNLGLPPTKHLSTHFVMSASQLKTVGYISSYMFQNFIEVQQQIIKKLIYSRKKPFNNHIGEAMVVSSTEIP